MKRIALGAVAALLGLLCMSVRAGESIVVGSKAFTEGYILGEIAAQTIESTSTVPVRKPRPSGE